MMQDNSKNELEKLIRKAKADSCWFYCVTTKQWYTPEEFELVAKAIIIQEGDKPHLFVNFNLCDPKQGIRTRAAYLKKASIELQDFTDRVMSYYNFVGKNVKS